MDFQTNPLLMFIPITFINVPKGAEQNKAEIRLHKLPVQHLVTDDVISESP